MNVKIDEEEKHRITVEVLKEWHEMIEEHDLKAAVEVILEYGMVHEEYTKWLDSQQT